MNKKPLYFSQKDRRWKDRPYQVEGERDTVGASGCGPSCAAMLISTITGKTFTPLDACRWSVEHGYKAKGQGTYYSYFTPQFAAFGIDCQMLNWSKTYGKPDHPNHELVEDKLRQGYYAIALMKKGLWTPTGHFVVLWWEDDKARILDPNSTRDDRTNGDLHRFRSEVMYYWIVDARAYNGTLPKPIPKPAKPAAKPEMEEKDMTQNEFEAMYDKMMQETQDNDSSSWSQEARDWAINAKLIAGGDPMPDGKPNYAWESLLTCERMMQILYAYARRQAELIADMAKQMMEGE